MATPFGPPFADGGMLMLETMPDGTMVGASLNTSNLYKIDHTTGVATLVGNLGFGNVMDFAVNSAGELWAVNNTDLWRVNPATGALRANSIRGSVRHHNQMKVHNDFSATIRPCPHGYLR